MLDPDIQHQRTRFSLSGFLALAVASVCLLGGGIFLQTGSVTPITQPLRWLSTLGAGVAAQALANWAEVMAATLAIAITVVAIVVELAANRSSHRVTTLFLREPVNIAVLSLFVLTTIQCVWVSLTIGESTTDGLLPQAGFAITFTMISLSLLLLLPYFAYVLSFISPTNIISTIANNAERSMRTATTANPQQISELRDQAALGIEELQNVTRSAVEQTDRNVAMNSVSALCHLMSEYQGMRARLPQGWFELDEHMREDPDFVSMEASALQPIQEHGLWFELKVFRQLIAVLDQCLPRMRDIANLIAIKTKTLGIEQGGQFPHLLTLCTSAFNSFLRASINARDPRTTYYLLNQYRMLAETLIGVTPSTTATIAEHLRYYGQLAYYQQQPFLLEVTAYDLVYLIEVSRTQNEELTDSLLDVLLELDLEIRSENEDASLIGVRKAQMQIGTLFLLHKDLGRAQRIADDLSNEPASRLSSIADQLRREDRPTYWELIERGANFSYLTPERRPLLAVLLGLIRR